MFHQNSQLSQTENVIKYVGAENLNEEIKNDNQVQISNNKKYSKLHTGTLMPNEGSQNLLGNPQPKQFLSFNNNGVIYEATSEYKGSSKMPNSNGGLESNIHNIEAP